jgi:hypothetical protein
MRPKTLPALFLAMVCLTPGLARAAKPVTETPVKVMIDDSYAGATVTSDDRGEYVSGIDGVRARIMTASGDLLINFDSAARYLRMNWSYDVTDAVIGYCNSPLYSRIPGLWPNIEPFATRPAVTFDSIGLLQVGESRSLGVVFNTEYGRARLKHRVNTQNDYCAGYLSVTRKSSSQWEIVSPGNPTPTSPYHDGIAVILQEFATSKNPNVTELRPVRYLNLPFKITVTVLP